jgi:predicted acylesterase/phospholipase RssA
MFAAWEVGVWKAIRKQFTPDLIIGASAGAWIGWAIAGGAAPEDIEREWTDPSLARIMQPGLHQAGVLRPDALHAKAIELFTRYRPRMPFVLTLVEVPSLRLCLVRESEITWRHLAATCSIPLCFPPVRIDGSCYVDGGFRGALPLWAAAKMGATRAVALNALTHLPFRVLRSVMRQPRPEAPLEVIRIEPSRPLGPVYEGLFWSSDRVKRWMKLGEADGNRAAISITM